jgi:hypothetical protein
MALPGPVTSADAEVIVGPAKKTPAQIVAVGVFEGQLWNAEVAEIDSMMGPFSLPLRRVIADAQRKQSVSPPAPSRAFRTHNSLRGASRYSPNLTRKPHDFTR